jgi:hypothetical protein
VSQRLSNVVTARLSNAADVSERLSNVVTTKLTNAADVSERLPNIVTARITYAVCWLKMCLGAETVTMCNKLARWTLNFFTHGFTTLSKAGVSFDPGTKLRTLDAYAVN